MTGADRHARPIEGSSPPVDDQLSDRLRLLGIIAADDMPVGLLARLRALCPSEPSDGGKLSKWPSARPTGCAAELGDLGPMLREEDLPTCRL